MSSQAQVLVLDKEMLLHRSALCRLRLYQQVRNLRSPPGPGRVARVVMLAARVILVIRLARSAIAWARSFGSVR